MKSVSHTYTFPKLFVTGFLLTVLMGCDMIASADDLPLFDPYRKDFACEVEATKTPPLDAEADDWYRQALASEDALELDEDPDYSGIVALTRRAAERRHWKAMLNLANLYLQKRDPEHGEIDAVQIVKNAMALDIPAAYDRMGVFHFNGTGVLQDTTRAYAYFQKAARMGNPDSMYFLGRRLNVGPNSERPGYWANKALALKFFECAFAQGHGNSALELYFSYRYPRDSTGHVIGGGTADTKARALKVLHAGVKLGCIACAETLSVEFRAPLSSTQTVAPHIDKNRAERYSVFAEALRYRRERRFPNLDSVLPLPPQELPPWDGVAATLVNAAMGVGADSAVVLTRDGKRPTRKTYLDSAYGLCRSGETTTSSTAPCGGYWSPASSVGNDEFKAEQSRVEAGAYEAGETFERSHVASARTHFNQPSVWERWLTVRKNQDSVDPISVAGLTRSTRRDGCLQAGVDGDLCPASGIWQPWVRRNHPLEQLVNQYWRQVWLKKDQPFPDPLRDWMLAITRQDITWHHMEISGQPVLE